ncbi:MAG: glyoxalase [Lachnospiraceae bacterium]|nr:glyoxalase [Lachnospiraceae bacterium]
MDYDKVVLQAFLEKQLQLFPEKVAETEEEAADFLDECMAVVVNSVKEVWEYFDEAGLDVEEYDEKSILEAEEVFEIGDGRYLILEA